MSGEHTSLSRRAVLTGGLALATAGAAWRLRPRAQQSAIPAASLNRLVPLTVGPWRYRSAAGVVVARPEEADGPVDTDGYDQLLARNYAAPGLPPIMLLIAYGSTQGGSLQLHRPETCYPGQGFRLADFADRSLALPGTRPVAARGFTAVRDDRIERLVYWTRIANAFPRNTFEEYSAILHEVLRGVVPDGILVRISSIGLDTAASDRAIEQFARQLLEASPAQIRALLVGPGAA